MKRIWIAVALAVIIISVCAVEHNATVNMYNNSTVQIDKMITAINNKDYDNAENSLQRIENDWASYKKNLSVFISHDILNQTDISLAKIKSSLNKRDGVDALMEANAIKVQIHEIKHTEEINTENLL